MVTGQRGNDLARVLEDAMTWVCANIDNYAPRFTWTPTLVRQRFGFLLDLTITSGFLEARDTPVAPNASAALDRAAEVFHSGSFHESLLSLPSRFPYYLWMLAVLRRHDRLTDRRLHLTAQRLIDEGHGGIADPARPLDRQLELRYILELGGFRSPMPPLDITYAEKAKLFPDPRESEADDAYRLTHVLFFLSRFGRRVLPELADDIALVDELLARYTRAGHWDLVAELVMCRGVLGQRGSEVEAHARKGLIQAQLPNGAMPGPGFDAAANAALPATERAADTFLRCYHTTLAAMMCAGADRPVATPGRLSHPHRPPAAESDPKPPPGPRTPR